VSGKWNGPVTGTDTQGDAVTGTLSFDFTSGKVTGSLNASVGGTALPAEAFKGTETCGQVEASQTASVLGISITATLNGTFPSTGTASGTWSATAGGSMVASGTFTATE
jgi:hypothetical protein